MKRTDLVQALEIVKPGLAGTDIIEQSTSFAFLNGRVATYNDEISISHPVEGLDITGAIFAEEMYAILKKLKGEDIDIKQEGNEIILTSGKSEVGFILQSEIKLPLEEVGDIGKWKKLPDNFLKGLQFTIPNCSSSSSAPILNCIHITKKEVEACDNYRISRVTLASEFPTEEFLIPKESAQVVLKLAPTHVAFGKGWVHFGTPEKHTILSCRIVEEKFPQLNDHLNLQGDKLTLPDTISEILDRASVLAKRDNAKTEDVCLSFSKGVLTVSSDSESGSWFRETCRVRFSDELTFHIIPSFMIDILKETHELIKGEKTIKLEGKNWEYLVVLRMNVTQ